MSTPPAFSIEGPLEEWIARHGRIVRRPSHADPGCASLVAVLDARPVFIRQARSPSAEEALERVVRVYEQVRHPALPPLWGYWRASDGPFVLFQRVAGVRLSSPIHVLGETQRLDPAGPSARFRALPVEEVLHALDTVFDLHLALAERDFVSGDFSDASIVYDFGGRRPWVVHLDEFREAPVEVGEAPRPGSPSFMAPEERQIGAALDERTTVFHLGRMALVLLGDGSGQPAGWRASLALRAVAEKATRASVDERHGSVRHFVFAWRRAAAPSAAEPVAAPLALPPPGPAGSPP